MSSTADLDQFRREWLTSLERRQTPAQTGRLTDHEPSAKAGSLNGCASDDLFINTIDKAALESPGFCAQLICNLDGASDTTRSLVAVRIYDIAAAEETQGSLGDSLRLYRLALRIDDQVDHRYSARHHSLPSDAAKPVTSARPGPTSAVSQSRLLERTAGAVPISAGPIADLISRFASVVVAGAEADGELERPPFSLFVHLPDDLLLYIFRLVAISDLADFAALARVCRHFAFVVATEEPIWRRIAQGSEHGFAAMHRHFATTISGRPIIRRRLLDAALDPASGTPSALAAPTLPRSIAVPTPAPYQSYRRMMRERPRVRFDGLYGSRTSYSRMGLPSVPISGNSPVHIVTYYRYLRFYRDGTAILLTSHERPAVVVPAFHREAIPSREDWARSRPHRDRVAALAANPHGQTVGGASSRLGSTDQDAVTPCLTLGYVLRGRWRLAVPEKDSDSEGEADGSGDKGKACTAAGPGCDDAAQIEIETEGSAPGYRNWMTLTFGHERIKSTKEKVRNLRVLEWRQFSYCKGATSAWSDYGMAQMKPYLFLRVRSYGNGVDDDAE